MPRVENENEFAKVDFGHGPIQMSSIKFVEPDYQSDLQFIVIDDPRYIEGYAKHFENELMKYEARLKELVHYIEGLRNDRRTETKTMLVKEEIRA